MYVYWHYFKTYIADISKYFAAFYLFTNNDIYISSSK